MSCLSPLSRKASFKRHHLGCGLTWRPSVSPSTSTMPKPRSPPPLLFSWEALHPSPHPPLSLLLLFFLPLDCCRIKPIRNCFSAKRQRYSYVPAWESGFVPPQPAPPRPSLTLRISLHQTLASQRIRLECGFVQMGSGVNFAGKPRAERRWDGDENATPAVRKTAPAKGWAIWDPVVPSEKVIGDTVMIYVGLEGPSTFWGGTWIPRVKKIGSHRSPPNWEASQGVPPMVDRLGAKGAALARCCWGQFGVSDLAAQSLVALENGDIDRETLQSLACNRWVMPNKGLVELRHPPQTCNRLATNNQKALSRDRCTWLGTSFHLQGWVEFDHSHGTLPISNLVAMASNL